MYKRQPYAVKEDTQEGAYTFIADSGAEFSIGFMPVSYTHLDVYKRQVYVSSFSNVFVDEAHHIVATSDVYKRQ